MKNYVLVEKKLLEEILSIAEATGQDQTVISDMRERSKRTISVEDVFWAGRSKILQGKHYQYGSYEDYLSHLATA